MVWRNYATVTLCISQQHCPLILLSSLSGQDVWMFGLFRRIMAKKFTSRRILKSYFFLVLMDSFPASPSNVHCCIQRRASRNSRKWTREWSKGHGPGPTFLSNMARIRKYGAVLTIGNRSRECRHSLCNSSITSYVRSMFSNQSHNY